MARILINEWFIPELHADAFFYIQFKIPSDLQCLRPDPLKIFLNPLSNRSFPPAIGGYRKLQFSQPLLLSQIGDTGVLPLPHPIPYGSQDYPSHLKHCERY